jgi:hypothetical protein
MIPASGRHYGWVAVTLASAALIVGCGGSGAADDAGKAAVKALSGSADEGLRSGATEFGDDGARAFPSLNQRLRQPAGRLAGESVTATRQDAERAVHVAFCEGWGIYKAYGGFPSSDEWYDIAANRIQSVAIPSPAVVSQVVSLYETAAGAFETGDLAAAQLDVYCQFG